MTRPLRTSPIALLLIAFSCALVLLPASMRAHGDEAHTLRFDNGLWLEDGHFVPRTFFSVDGLLQRATERPVEQVIDLGGGFVVPPFADAHRHVLDQPHGAEAERDRLLRAGIFYVKNPSNQAAQAGQMTAWVNRPTSVDVRYSHASLTSTGGHPIPIYEGGVHGAHGATPEKSRPKPRLEGLAYFVIDDADDLERRWSTILASEPDFLKVNLVVCEEYEARRSDPAFYGKRGLDPALLPDIVSRAHAAGLRVSAHVESAADVRVAVTAGVDEINHLPLERLEANDAERLARAGTVVVTTALSHRPTDHVEDLAAIHRHNLRLLHEAAVVLAIGTDNNQVTAYDEVAALHRLAGFTPASLLALWTDTASRTVFPNRPIGRLAAGYEASFLVLGGNPLNDLEPLRDIRLRVKQGRVLHLPEATPALPSVAEAMLQPLLAGDVDGAIEAFHRVLQEAPLEYDTSEARINEIGYRLLEHGQAAAATRILALNTNRFPTSANAWDSLAEAALAADENEQAIAAYRRVLALLPDADLPASFAQQLLDNAHRGLKTLGARNDID